MMTHKFFLLAICVAAALALAIGAPTVVAQDDATNETEQDDERFADIDGNTYVEDWSYSGTAYHISVNSTESTTVYAMPPLDSADEGSGSLDVATTDLDGKQTRELTVQGDGEVVLMTESFLETGDHLRLSSGSQAIVGPPYTAADLWIATGATTVAIGVTVVIRVFSHLLGVGRSTERVA